MGRREQVTRIIRRKLQQQKDPVVIVMPDYTRARTPNSEPAMVICLAGYRVPTEDEVIAAIVKAGYTEQAARSYVRKSHNKPAAEAVKES